MVKKTIHELKGMLSTGQTPTGDTFSHLIDSLTNELSSTHIEDEAPHQYGGKFEWRYNSTTNSLDLVVLD